MSKSPSLRRIQADIRELSIDPSDRYHAAPLENDMFVWHFTIRGADGTDFEGGVYHGKILLPAEYPFKPPNIMFLTPSGRFETNIKVCLSFSAYHPELWQPAWGIRLILEALVSFLPTKGDGAIGALDWTSEERKRLAKRSLDYCCPTCGNCAQILDRLSQRIKDKGAVAGKAKGGTTSRFQKEIEQLHALQVASEGGKQKKENQKQEEEKSDVKEKKISEESFKDIKVPAVEAESKAKGMNLSETTKQDLSGLNKTDENEENQTTQAKKEQDLQMNSTDTCTDKKHDNSKSDSESDTQNNTKTAEKEDEQINTGLLEENIIENEIINGDDGRNANVEIERVEESPLLSDPVIHAGIIIFGVIVYLLLRKIQDIIVDMKELESQFLSS
mmetsp:Transcript_5434/g.6944  ORF Transcript_5434/g.6944 Transcript_5434/m.6944 type:complete len:388 (-) Transcript_5434:168-1331(-)